MNSSARSIFGAMAVLGAAAFPAAGQLTPPKPTPLATATGPQVGQVAPDFTLPGSTRYGLLSPPVRLSDFRGRTVVLAFFYQARTKG